MPPAVIAAAVAAAGSIGGGAMGAMAQTNASKRSANLAKDAARRFYDVEDPNYENMKLQLEQLVQSGQLTPEMEENILQNPTAFEQANQDPRLRQTEMDALSTLANISNEGGMDAQARLGMEEARIQGDAQARGSREANLQNAAQRGVAGSGLEFVSNQMADQNSANQSSIRGMQEAAAANARDLQALQGMTNTAGQIENQDFSRQSALAKARDDISRFNTAAQQSVQQRNVGARNTALSQNLAEKQRISDQNTLIRNQEQQYNKGLEHQRFEDQMAKAQGAAGLVGNQQSAINAQGQAMGNLFGGIGQSIGGAGSSIAGYYAKQESDDKLLKALAAKGTS